MGFPGARLGLCRQLNMHNSPKTKRPGLLIARRSAEGRSRTHKMALITFIGRTKGRTHSGRHTQPTIHNQLGTEPASLSSSLNTF